MMKKNINNTLIRAEMTLASLKAVIKTRGKNEDVDQDIIANDLETIRFAISKVRHGGMKLSVVKERLKHNVVFVAKLNTLERRYAPYFPK